MPTVHDLHQRSSLLHANDSSGPPASNPLGNRRPGETSGERRIRLLRTVLGDLSTHPGP
jgi:hypothetical protein